MYFPQATKCNLTQPIKINSQIRSFLRKSILKNLIAIMINLSTLFCYFRNLKVNFIDRPGIKSPLNGGAMNQMTKYSVNKKIQKKSRLRTETPEKSCHYPIQMCSESKDNYRGVKPVISSLIKHKNLATLQYGYRKSANA